MSDPGSDRGSGATLCDDGTIDRSPPRFSAWVAVGTAVLAVAAVGRASATALVFGVAGGALVLAGLGVARKGPVTVGSALLFCGVLAAGTVGAATRPLLVAGAATVVCWDVGRYAVDLGAQLGRAASTVRVELLHVAVSALVASATVGAAYAASRTVAGGQPVVALVALLLAGALLSFVLR
jgi:hypothetical protein